MFLSLLHTSAASVKPQAMVHIHARVLEGYWALGAPESPEVGLFGVDKSPSTLMRPKSDAGFNTLSTFWVSVASGGRCSIHSPSAVCQGSNLGDVQPSQRV